MTDVERFRMMLSPWDSIYEWDEYHQEHQVARRIIQGKGLGDPAESIQLSIKTQIEMALEILIMDGREYETTIGY